MNTTTFNVGQTYSTRSICNWDTIYNVTIIKRTAKQVTIKDPHNAAQTKRCGVYMYEGVEKIKPHGSYSMCAVISADDKDLSTISRGY